MSFLGCPIKELEVSRSRLMWIREQVTKPANFSRTSFIDSPLTKKFDIATVAEDVKNWKVRLRVRND